MNEGTPEPGKLNTITVIASAACFALLLAAAVALALAGWDTAAIIGLLTAVAGPAGILMIVVDRLISIQWETRRQTPMLQSVSNGSMSALITKIVEDALERRFGKVTPPTTTEE